MKLTDWAATLAPPVTQYPAEYNKLFAAMPCSRPDGAFIAGGAVTSVFTNQPINDVDVYFKTKEAFIEAVRYAYEEDFLWCINASKRAVTFAHGDLIVQFMYFDFFPTAQDIFNSFDFTVCMGAFDCDTKEWVFHEDFLKHNSQRFLRFNSGTRYPIASALRALKYKDRGYTIGNGEFLKILLAARTPEINSWEELKDQIGGSYGDAVALENEGIPYSPQAAVNSINPDRVWVRETQDNPGNPEDLLLKIGFSSQEIDKVFNVKEVA